MHLLRLLQEEVETHPQRRERFVHAYLAGFGVPLELFSQTLLHLRPTACADDVGTVSSWRTASWTHPDLHTFRMGAYHAGVGWKRVSGDMLTTSPITWASGPGAAPSRPAQYKGAMWPMPANMDPRDSEAGVLPSGCSLRFGHAAGRTRQALGYRVRELVPVDCGEVTAQADERGYVRVAPFPRDSLFSLTERDWLLYHEVDLALFHNNLQENVGLRVAAWRRATRSRRSRCVGGG
uniref:Uncharacterized protein n=1 Tax=Zooxanthella nutricula TaxID=1333877 RepID=A0A7S2H929_9DINO|mmetsp:Transcript_101177/g.309395  ORF Transcript_101177/g.309395 Transcript_101177/m.309395 type:complete len:236 (+) Transcript_101177:1-708(+)